MNKELLEMLEKLKARRVKLGYSQSDVARHLGLKHRGQVSKLEDGQTKLTVQRLLEICDLLGIEVTLKEKPLSESEIVEAVKRMKSIFGPLEKTGFNRFENWLVDTNMGTNMDEATKDEIVKMWRGYDATKKN